MVIQQSFPGPSGVTDQTEARKDLAGLILRDTSGNPRGGIFPRHTNDLVTARSDMQVNVAAFEGASIRGGGPLFIANDGTAQPSVGAIVSPVANSQYHVVYAKQNESASPYSDANDNAILGIQSGIAAPSPDLAAVVAALPAGAIPLASVLMPSGKTATNQSGVVIAPLFQYATLTGGTIWARTKTEVDALTGYAEGTYSYCFGEKILYRFDGTTWKPWSSGWIAWTATLTSVTGTFTTVGTGGSAEKTTEYMWVNGRAQFRIKLVLGTTGFPTSFTGILLSLPFNLRQPVPRFAILEGRGNAYDLSASAASEIVARLNDTSPSTLILASFSGTPVTINNTAPFTPAAGDTYEVRFIADAA